MPYISSIDGSSIQLNGALSNPFSLVLFAVFAPPAVLAAVAGVVLARRLSFTNRTLSFAPLAVMLMFVSLATGHLGGVGAVVEPAVLATSLDVVVEDATTIVRELSIRTICTYPVTYASDRQSATIIECVTG